MNGSVSSRSGTLNDPLCALVRLRMRGWDLARSLLRSLLSTLLNAPAGRFNDAIHLAHLATGSQHADAEQVLAHEHEYDLQQNDTPAGWRGHEGGTKHGRWV